MLVYVTLVSEVGFEPTPGLHYVTLVWDIADYRSGQNCGSEGSMNKNKYQTTTHVNTSKYEIRMVIWGVSVATKSYR